MKAKLTRNAVLFLAAAMGLVAGCVHGLGWDDRVGTYTYDQAVKDYGQPSTKSDPANGTYTAEWVNRYPQAGAPGMGVAAYQNTPMGGPQSGPAYNESHLRLVFTTNNVLAGWSKD